MMHQEMSQTSWRPHTKSPRFWSSSSSLCISAGLSQHLSTIGLTSLELIDPQPKQGGDIQDKLIQRCHVSSCRCSCPKSPGKQLTFWYTSFCWNSVAPHWRNCEENPQLHSFLPSCHEPGKWLAFWKGLKPRNLNPQSALKPLKTSS